MQLSFPGGQSMFRRWMIACLLPAVFCPAALAQTYTVTVNVVAANEVPVPKAEVSPFWRIENGVMTPSRNFPLPLVYGDWPLITDAQGKAVLRLKRWNNSPALVLSADRKLGGLVKAPSEADAGKVVTVRLGPVSRVKGTFTCSDLGQAPKWARTTITADGFGQYFSEQITETAEFDCVLPAGKYTLRANGGQDVERMQQTMTLSADKPEVDLGAMNVKASQIGKMKGQVLPDWSIVAARGVKADVKLADYRGKWVFIEFWHTGCGPCCAVSLPKLMALYEDYKDHRDKFEVFAIHSEESIRSLADLDKELPFIKEHHWYGKDLPFPVLLDRNEETEKKYGIREHPTSLLIDPDGKLVGAVTEEALEAKLPPLPAAKRWARRRDLGTQFWTFEPANYTLKKLGNTISAQTRCPVELDPDAVKAAGLTPDTPLPGLLIGWSVSLRSIDELLLAPHGLGVVPSADNKALRISKRAADNSEPSLRQTRRQKELNAWLDNKEVARAVKTSLAISDEPLVDAVKRIVDEFDLPMAIDARALHAKAIDPKARVSGRIGPADLRNGLAELLNPLGLQVTVRHEVVLVMPKGQ
jgi:thiol-disulfide isomerase/thioredoxin